MIGYQTYLDGSPNESLEYSDSIMKIKFDTKPNGIYFDIENLTKKNLYLIWDKSYFIEPDGGSSKALNTDILETSKEIRDKENYESIIPQKGHFVRFTCSSKNISFFDDYNSLTIYNEVTKSISTYAFYNKFYQTGEYWYLGEEKIPYTSDKDIPIFTKQQISKVQKVISTKNNLSLGFTIKNKENEIEYHFRFPIKTAEIFKKTSSDPSYIKVAELNKDNNFNPGTFLEPSKGIQEIKTIQDGNQNWIIIKCINCGEEIRITGTNRGNINCPKCGTLNTIGGK
jgi:ribosomal protein S27E